MSDADSAICLITTFSATLLSWSSSTAVDGNDLPAAEEDR